MKTYLRNSSPVRFVSFVRSFVEWNKRMYGAPSPLHIKQACLMRNGIANATWVETGTYRGQTTQFLSDRAEKVFSIEPEPTLFANAKVYFSSFSNVEIIDGTSEEVFPALLPKINGDVNFWLDGHYSGGVTFRGPRDTPIIEELKHIGANLSHFTRACIFVDDVRCFDPTIPEYSMYPPLDFLVDWARSQRLHWHIEHDIFCAKKKS